MSASRIQPSGWKELFVNATKGYVEFDPPYPGGGGDVLNLGSGNSPISGAVNLDRPDWEAPSLAQFNTETIAAVHAYHFLEHLDGDTVKEMLSEISRVLRPGGVFYYCVPYAMAPIAFMDVDHKTFWTEETMRTLIAPRGYNSGPADLRLDYWSQVIVGVNSQNLMIIGVLTKGK